MRLVEDARCLEEAGCFSFVIECVPEIVGEILTRSVHIPTIGIARARTAADRCWCTTT